MALLDSQTKGPEPIFFPTFLETCAPWTGPHAASAVDERFIFLYSP